MARNVSVILIEEARDSRTSLKRQLAMADFAVIGEAGYGQESFALSKELSPDVVIVSVEEPIARALRTIESLAIVAPETPIIAVSSQGGREYLRKAMLAGAREYLTTPLRQDELREAILSVLRVEEKKKLSQAGPDNEIAHSGSIITVFGAKGGIGKTTLATNISVAIATTLEQQAVLVDLDTQFGGAAVMMDVVPQRSVLDLAQALDEIDSKEALKSFLTMHESGVAIVAAPLRPDEEQVLSAEQIKKILNLITQSFDYVIVDTPPMLTEAVVTALEESTMVLLVTSLEIVCIKNTKLCLEMMKSSEFSSDKVKLVINRANAANSLKAQDLETTLGYPVFWKVPFDMEAAVSAQLGRPLVQVSPNSKAAQSIIELLETIGGARKSTAGGSFLGGFMNRFKGKVVLE